jgi:hypothetical protein
MNAGNLPGSVTEGGGGSVLQAMLRDYLTHNKKFSSARAAASSSLA